MIRVIVGLGNPGLQYQKTRHNAGFLFLDSLADFYSVRWVFSKKTQSEIAEIEVQGQKVFLCKPMLFMNKSGLPVGALLKYYAIAYDQIIVAHDDLELRESAVKMKFSGGHAGHNGVRDIIAQLGSAEFFRLRFGIGRPSQGFKVADYVLSGFSAEELIALNLAFDVLLKNSDLLATPDLEKVNAMF